jgi:tRNA threonylcarbamoyladenosine biosynthesis protein TsaB
MAFGRTGFVAAAIDARRGQIYLQLFGDGATLTAPDAVTLETAAARIAEVYAGGPATFTGSGAPLLYGILSGAVIETPDGPDPVAVAGARRSPSPSPLPSPPPPPPPLPPPQPLSPSPPRSRATRARCGAPSARRSASATWPKASSASRP